MSETLEQRDDRLVREAIYYSASRFAGRGVYETSVFKTRAGAVNHAKITPGMRRWLIYAVTASESQVLTDTIVNGVHEYER